MTRRSILLPVLLSGLLLCTLATPVAAQEETPLPPAGGTSTPAPQDPDVALPPLEDANPLPPVEPFDPPGPILQPWEDHDDATVMMARGGIGICRAATLPLRLIPNVGLLLALGLEWGCIIPTAIAVDSTQRGHGTRKSFVWEALVSLMVMKAWRDLADLPVFLNLLALSTGVTVGTLGALALTALVALVTLVASWSIPSALRGWLPVALSAMPTLVGGAVTYSALVFVLLAVLRDSVGEWLFSLTYKTLSGKYARPGEQWEAQRRGFPRPRLNFLERTWLLASVASGAQPTFSLWHYVPLVGPGVKAYRRSIAMKEMVRRVSADDLRDGERTFDVVDFTIVALCALEGGVGVLTHASIMLSAFLFTVGFAGLLVQFFPPARNVVVAGATGTAGAAATAAGVVALFLVVLRDAPGALLPFAVPAAYGLWPTQGFFPDRE